MARFTKKYMIDDYERLYAHADLLELYLYDTQAGDKPDAVEKYKDSDGLNCRAELWRAKSASGGYVVITEAISNIYLLDGAVRIHSAHPTQYNLALRCALERLTVKRAHIVRGE